MLRARLRIPAGDAASVDTDRRRSGGGGRPKLTSGWRTAWYASSSFSRCVARARAAASASRSSASRRLSSPPRRRASACARRAADRFARWCAATRASSSASCWRAISASSAPCRRAAASYARRDRSIIAALRAIAPSPPPPPLIASIVASRSLFVCSDARNRPDSASSAALARRPRSPAHEDGLLRSI